MKKKVNEGVPPRKNVGSRAFRAPLRSGRAKKRGPSPSARSRARARAIYITQGEKKMGRVLFHVSSELKEAVQVAARSEGLSMSDYIRRVIRENVGHDEQPTEQTVDLKNQIIWELGRSAQLLGAKSDLLSTIMSVGDSIPDKEALTLIRVCNKALKRSQSPPVTSNGADLWDDIRHIAAYFYCAPRKDGPIKFHFDEWLTSREARTHAGHAIANVRAALGLTRIALAARRKATKEPVPAPRRTGAQRSPKGSGASRATPKKKKP